MVRHCFWQRMFSSPLHLLFVRSFVDPGRDHSRTFATATPKLSPPIPGPGMMEGDRYWRLVSGVVVERLPVIMRDPEPWELEWTEWRERQMQERTRNFPFQDPKAGSDAADAAKQDEADAEAAADFVFEPAPRVTADDRAKNMRSLNRQLDRRLYLIVKKNRAQHAWQFPQGGREQRETMREVCVRAFVCI